MGNRAYGAGYKEGYKKAMEEMSKNKRKGCFGVLLLLIVVSTSLFFFI